MARWDSLVNLTSLGRRPFDAVARSLLSPRDSRELEEDSGLRPAIEVFLRLSLLERKSKGYPSPIGEGAPAGGRLERGACDSGSRKYVVEARRCAEELKSCQESLILEIPSYREYDAYRRDVDAHIALHMEDIVT
nr:uncharacterized protein LOC109181117 [Ipomoea trifida]